MGRRRGSKSPPASSFPQSPSHETPHVREQPIGDQRDAQDGGGQDHGVNAHHPGPRSIAWRHRPPRRLIQACMRPPRRKARRRPASISIQCCICAMHRGRCGPPFKAPGHRRRTLCGRFHQAEMTIGYIVRRRARPGQVRSALRCHPARRQSSPIAVRRRPPSGGEAAADVRPKASCAMSAGPLTWPGLRKRAPRQTARSAASQRSSHPRRTRSSFTCRRKPMMTVRSSLRPTERRRTPAACLDRVRPARRPAGTPRPRPAA